MMQRSACLCCLWLALVAGAGIAQHYHAPEYLAGGSWSAVPNPPNYVPGIFVVKNDGSFRTVAKPPQFAVGFCMDVDNRHFVALISDHPYLTNKSGMAGLYRFDPNTMAQTTIYGPDTINLALPYRLHVNQDGDYILDACITTSAARHYRVLKVSRSGVLTTVMTTLKFGARTFLTGYIGRNIDNGKLLICGSSSSAATVHYPVFELAPDGTTTFFNNGPGWEQCYQTHCSQNVSNGHLEGPYFSHLFQLRRGSGSRTTLATLRHGSTTAQRVCDGKFDLQTASTRRWVSMPIGRSGLLIDQWLAYVAPDGTVTSIRVQAGGLSLGVKDFDFYRGRHLQTVKSGPHRWDIRISCPRSPGDGYALAASLSGVRPGIALPDGRRINLVVDALTYLTLHNRLPGIFHPGPAVLDSRGEARGFLDLASLKPPPGGFGIPVWIAVAVLDPRSPTGIKYLPDTYVMRI